MDTFSIDYLPAIIIVRLINHSALSIKDVVCFLSTCVNINEFGRYWEIKKFVSIDNDSFQNKYYQNLTDVQLKNKVEILPKALKKLTFNHCFNQPIQNYVPTSVRYVEFGINFNQPINDCFSLGLKYLIFGSCFNQPIRYCIPTSVTCLQFGDSFNQPIENCIPPKVKDLHFGYNFN